MHHQGARNYYKALAILVAEAEYYHESQKLPDEETVAGRLCEDLADKIAKARSVLERHKFESLLGDLAALISKSMDESFTEHEQY